MRKRWFDGVVVVASWSLVAVPAVMLLRGTTHQIVPSSSVLSTRPGRARPSSATPTRKPSWVGTS